MNTYKLIKWARDNSLRSEGEEAAWIRFNEELTNSVDADKIETKVLLESVPEPSDSERSEWKETTKEYVCMLENIADSVIGSGDAPAK